TLDESVACEEETLQQIEVMAEAVRANTSPAGAEAVQEEAEELRLGWQRLRQGLCVAQDGLHCSLDSHSQYQTRCHKLGEEIGRIRVLLQELDQELEDTQESKSCSETTEEQMEGQWRKYSVELLKSQLKELFRFSEDSRHLSDDVLAVVKEHQRLCSESELELRSILQDPLLNFSQWKNYVSQGLLQNSVQLQERLSLLQVKGDLLDSVFGPEGSDSLQEDLSSAVKTRELLHNKLLERESRLQSLISRTKDFDEALQLILTKSSAYRERLLAADVLQPDILAKRSQLDQMLVLQKELEDGEAQLTALKTLVSSSQSSRTQYEQLCADWTELHRRVMVKVQDCAEIVSDHESFHSDLLNTEKWMMVMSQKLESFRSSTGGWSVEGRQPEAQVGFLILRRLIGFRGETVNILHLHDCLTDSSRLLGEFPEKELHLQQMEVQSEKVLSRTSMDGQVHILNDMERVKERWYDLQTLSLNLNRLCFCSDRLLDGSSEMQFGSAKSSKQFKPELLPPAQTVIRPDSKPQVQDSSGSCQTDGPTGGGEADSLETAASSREDASRDSRGLSKINWSQFEAWLSREYEVLTKITKTDKQGLSAEEVQTRRGTLQALISRLPEGQQMFQLLLQQTQNNQGVDETLEALRYRWMLYKTRLKEEENNNLTTTATTKRDPDYGIGSVSETRTEKVKLPW
ncbi:hypothetical protein XENOCAPTIV_024473, partial [Xenoophorus captivus]